MSHQSRNADPSDPQVEAALRDYLERIDRGERVDREEFISRHAEIADALLSFFTTEERFRKMDAPCDDDSNLRGSSGEPQAHANVDAAEAATFPPRENGPADPARAETMAYDSPMDGVGAVIAGRYKLLETLGQGGMGAVFMAQQTQPVKRLVALKLIKLGMDSKLVLARFEAERQALALMDHPNIAKVLDAGATESGRPFFVMELVKGVPITQFCDARQLSPRQRLELFIPVCQAIQHAHQKGIIHRDIKPTNVLVALYDDRAVPKVIDFGVSKATGQQLTDASLMTGFGAIVGTPEYMSPEQAQLNQLDIDTRSDVYALGVLLYELLTGTTPIDRKRLGQGALFEVLRIIREEEPPRPSTRLSTSEALASIAATRKTEPAKLAKLMRGELDWIVMKCLEKDRARRYETANGLARDVDRFLNHEPVLAGPPSARYRLKKFVQRNRGQVVAAALVLLALVVGIAGTTTGLIRAEQQRWVAEFNEHMATEAANAERQARAHEAEQRTKAEKARDRTRQALDAMTSDVTGDSLTTQKEISADQKKFLTEVLKYYQQFAGERADDEMSRVRTAAAAFRVALIQFRLGRMEQAMAAFRMAQDGYATLAADFPTKPGYRLELGGNHTNLGAMLAGLGKLSEAEEEYRKALPILQKLAADFPAKPANRDFLACTYDNLGKLLQSLGKWSEAEGNYRQAVIIGEKLVGEFPVPQYRQNTANSQESLGFLLGELGRPSDAEEEYRKALAIQEKLAADFPAVPAYRSDLSDTYDHLGLLLVQMGKWPQAEEHHRKAMAIGESLAVEFPSVPAYRSRLADSRQYLGLLLKQLGKWPQAEEHHREAMALRETLATEFPAVPEYRSGLADSRQYLGLLLTQLGKLSEAEEQANQALGIHQKLVAQFPTVLGYQGDLASDYLSRGRVLGRLGKRSEAQEDFRKSLFILEKLANDFPTVPDYRFKLAQDHNLLAILLHEMGKQSEHEEETRKAMAILEKLAADYPEVPKYRYDLGVSCAVIAISRINAGQVTEGIADVAELAKSSNWPWENWYNFACAYALASSKSPQKKQQYGDRAMELLNKAVHAGFREAPQLKQDADFASLHDREDFKKLLAKLATVYEAAKKP